MYLGALRLLVDSFQAGSLFGHFALVVALLSLESFFDAAIELDLFLGSMADLASLVLLLEAGDAQAEVLDELVDLVELRLVHLLYVGLLASVVLLGHRRHEHRSLTSSAIGGTTDATGQGRGG